MTTLSRRTVSALVCAGLLALTACSGSDGTVDSPAPPTAPPPTPDPQDQRPGYVALGDSYTAGGPIDALQNGGERCQRSQRNYPTLVAAALDYALTDVSCGGATTGSVLGSAQGVPAQIDAVTRDTEVITVGIGGNDFGFYGKLLVTCPAISKPGGAGAPCRDRLGAEATTTIRRIGKRVAEVLAAVGNKAPQARVLLVGYPRLMPDSGGGCANTPFTAGDVGWVSSLEAGLSTTMDHAATANGATFVPMYTRSKGHDLCSGDAAWVNGLHPASRDGLVLHPNGAGESAIADAVEESLRSSAGA